MLWWMLAGTCMHAAFISAIQSMHPDLHARFRIGMIGLQWPLSWVFSRLSASSDAVWNIDGLPDIDGPTF